MINVLEGQRKALFEESEAQQKLDLDEISKLKREIVQLSAQLIQKKNPSAKYSLKSKEIEQILVPHAEKSYHEVQSFLDSQIIDKKKKIDLARFRTKQVSVFIDILSYVIITVK